MGAEEPPTQPKIHLAANSRVKIKPRSIPNIVIMVAGTTHPGNTMDMNEVRAGSDWKTGRIEGVEDYWAEADGATIRAMKAQHWYWADNPNLRVGLTQLKDDYWDVRLFPFHAWSGNNHPANRRVAGAYLCDRLHGGGEEKAFFQKYLHREVHFHLIGHSHGGNVINEFLRRAADAPDWPSKWKVRSVVYQSTPFFQRLHQPKTGAMHEDCEILALNNKYDLTQQILADFSLHLLKERFDAAGGDAVIKSGKQLLESLKGIGDSFMQALKAPGMDLGFGRGDLALGVPIDPTVTIQETPAKALYSHLISSVERLVALLEAVELVLKRFHVGVVLEVPKSLENDIESEQQVVSDRLYGKWMAQIVPIKKHAELVRASLYSRVRSETSQFTWAALARDLWPELFFSQLSDLIALDSNSRLSGPLWDLVAETVEEQVVEFDNTGTDPTPLYAGTPFASRVQTFDVTNMDSFVSDAQAPGRAHAAADRLFQRLKSLEQVSNSETKILFILTALLANLDVVRRIFEKYANRASMAFRLSAWLDNVDGFQKINDIANAFLPYVELARSYDEGGTILYVAGGQPLEWIDPVGEDVYDVGSILYFSKVSHSVSRSTLYQDVEDFLRKQFTCGMKPKARRKIESDE